LKALNKTATQTLNDILNNYLGSKRHMVLDKTNESFMPLSVERLYSNDAGTFYSFCHYFKQNGDMCQDPEMLFIKTKSGKVYPAMFQSYPNIYEESIFQDDGKWKVHVKMQADHAKFANLWLKNIKEQQKL
jgi:hypothetical protein